MTANRFRKIIRARWWVLVLVAIVSIGVASLVNGMRDSTRLDRKAVAGITYLRLLGELDDTAVQERLTAGKNVAEEANAGALARGLGPLAAGATHEIAVDLRDNRLIFRGFGTDDEEATERALEIRDRFLEEQALDGTAEIDRRINVVGAQLDEVVAEIAAATEVTPKTPEDVARESRIAELNAEVAALTGRYGALTVELVTPPVLIDPAIPPRSTDAILAEREDVRAALLTAQTELTAFESSIVVEPEDPAVSLLRTRETQLRLALDTLVAQRIIEEPIGVLDPVEVFPVAIVARPTSTVLLIGLLVGVLIGVIGLVLVDRIRQPLWSVTDLAPQYRLPEIPKRAVYPSGVDGPWYATAPSGGRKTGIQQLRSQVEGLSGFGTNLAVGIAAVSGHARDVHELTADLASSLVSSGGHVLVVDADFDHPSNAFEYHSSGRNLEEVLEAGPLTRSDTGARVEANPGVVGIAAAGQGADSPDLLAQPGFARFLEDARVAFDVVIVACPASDSATYHVLTQRLDAMILVAVAGETLTPQVDAGLDALDDRRSRAVGVVLLTRAEHRLSGWVERFRQRRDSASSFDDVEPAVADDEPEPGDAPDDAEAPAGAPARDKTRAKAQGHVVRTNATEQTT